MENSNQEFEKDLNEELAEIAEKYEDKNYFQRLRDMMSGLKQPHDSPEYKKARTELQRQAAPLIAFVSVLLFVTTLIVVTALQPDNSEKFIINAQQQEEEIIPEDEPEEEPEPPPDPEPTPMEDVDIPLDTPNPGPVSDITPMPSPPSQNVSVKPAEADTVAFVNSPVKMRSMVGSRNPGSIGKATSGGAGNGDATTEAAVLKVLWYLKSHQNSDGSWKGRGKTGSPISDTGLAILTYLAHGEYEGSPSPYRKDFGPTVSAGIQYLVNNLQPSENPLNVRLNGSDNHEYAFLIGTYALCEAYGMTKNPACKEVAMQTLSRIIKGQSPTGGWDYNINPQSERDDMSFAGWALQALKAGKMADMHPDGLNEAIQKAIRCLKSRNFKNGGFNYTAGGAPTGLTATGCLAMQLLGYSNESQVKSALNTMRDWLPSFEGGKGGGLTAALPGPNPQYYSYYATQCKYQAGMRAGATKEDELAWQTWNKAMKALYPSSITDVAETVPDYKGGQHKQGYYLECINDNYSNDIMSSCLVALQLMVYYRYLPTTQTKASDLAGDAGGGADNEVAGGADKDDVKVEVDI